MQSDCEWCPLKSVESSLNHHHPAGAGPRHFPDTEPAPPSSSWRRRQVRTGLLGYNTDDQDDICQCGSLERAHSTAAAHTETNLEGTTPSLMERLGGFHRSGFYYVFYLLV